MHEKIIEALTQIRPNAEWILSGDDYDSLEWLDKKQSKPSFEEIENAISNPPAKSQQTIEQKLASAGLDLDDLKAALGL